MKMRTLLTAALFLSSVSIPALAAATPEEAATIKASFETYLGQTQGVVTVTPEGNAYTIKLDPAPLIAKIPDQKVKFFAEPYVMSAEPKGNGQWAVSSKGTWGLQLSGEQNLNMSMRIADQNWSGTYDSNLAAFTQSSGTFNNMVMSQTIPDPTGLGGASNVNYTIGAITMESTATPASVGVGVDINQTMTASDVVSATSMATPDGQTPSPDAAIFNYTLASPKLVYKSTGKSVNYRPLLELVAWFVANPDKQMIINGQAELKQKIQAALPMFQNVTGNMIYEGLTVSTALGQFEAASAGIDVNMNGLVKDGLLQEKFSVSGLKIPAGIAPPWAQDLIPTTTVFDFSIKGFNIEAPTQLALGQLDLAKPEPLPAGFEMMLLPAFLPAGTVNIDLGAGEISNALYSITYDGQFLANISGAPPTGTANIRMKGIDAVIAKLQAGAAEPNVQQALAGLIGMKGFGKVEADGTTLWAIDATTPGKVLVNGLDVSAMLGMAPPTQQ